MFFRCVACSSLRNVLFARDSASDFGAQDLMESRFSFSFFSVWIHIFCNESKYTRRKDAFEDLLVLVVRENTVQGWLRSLGSDRDLQALHGGTSSETG